MWLKLKKIKIKNVEFWIILCIWEPIIRSLLVVSKSLQSVNLSLQRASTQQLLEIAILIIEKLQHKNGKIVKDLKKLCMKWSICYKLNKTCQK